VDAFLKPGGYLGLLSSHHIRAIVNDLLPAVRGASTALATVWGDAVANLPGYRKAMIECAVVFNAALTASILHAEFDDPARDRRTVFGVYNLASRRVHVPQPGESAEAPAIRLVETPTDLESFRKLATEVASSPYVRELLGV